MVWIGGRPERSGVIFDAIRQLERSSDRAIAIIASAILEEHMTNVIKRRWQQHPTTIARILHPEGPLGSFGPKIDLVLLMGLISSEGHADLKLIKRIRNRFAHYLEVDNFETPEIRSRCFELKHFEKFVLTNAEMSGPTPPKKLFGIAGMDEKLKTPGGRFIVAVQVYSVLFGGDFPAHLPPPNVPSPIY